MKWPGSSIRDRNAPQREAAVRYDQREELSRAGTGMENNAARKRRTMAILKSALAKPWSSERMVEMPA